MQGGNGLRNGEGVGGGRVYLTGVNDRWFAAASTPLPIIEQTRRVIFVKSALLCQTVVAKSN